MAQFPALPLFTDAYLGDTTHLTTIEHGAYLLLLMAAWRSKDCKLSHDDKLLARYAKLSPSQWNRIKPIILDFFTIENGFIFQGRLSDELTFVKQKSKSQSDKAKARWLKTKQTTDAGASSGQSKSTPPTPTPTPTPSKKVIDKSITKNNRGTRLSKDWVLPDEWKAWAMSQGADATLEGEKFYNYWISKAGQGATKLDWGATWKNWILNSYGGKPANSSGSGMASLLAKEWLND